MHSPNGTGDWHSAAALNDDAYPQDFYIYGKDQTRSTLHLLGNVGVIDGTNRFNEMGYYPENSPVWLADHPRACVDYLYTAVLQTGSIGEVMLDEWFPSSEDKQSVYDLLNQIEPHLNPKEWENLQLWKRKNPIM
ncbi:hypothetical protein [Neisseria lactamica]|uniref:Uncharacterized protein n=1 Tax=Neisseria lactamica TaxID=486 RepID=A0AAU8VGL0_NEILA|nr:hypothetical protein [Neisseria lactamica]ARB04656.1 hypothetical protein B2G52_06940 [Neisseria lactamica]CBX21461.1 unnamed protein product [Neisseria lactamica Y92-1009]